MTEVRKEWQWVAPFLIYTLSGPIRVVAFSDIHTFKVYSFTQEGRTFSVAEGFLIMDIPPFSMITVAV